MTTSRPGRQRRRLWALLRRHQDETTSPRDDGPGEDVDVLAASPLDDGARSLRLPLVLAVVAGILLSLLRSPFDDAGWPLRWPPAAFTTADAVAVLGVSTAIILGTVLEGRGAADRITTLRHEGAAALRAEERSLVRRYERAAGLSGGVASFAAIIGTSSFLTLLPVDVFAGVMVGLLSAVVVSLSSFVSTTSREARAALRKENDLRQQREVRTLRIVETYWTAAHRPPRPHGVRRVVVLLASLSVALVSIGSWALLTHVNAALGLLLLATGLVPPLVAFTVFRVVLAAALQRTSERVGPWLAFVPIWVLFLVVVTFATAVLGSSYAWLAVAVAALVGAHVITGTWAVSGLLWERGAFRHLRPSIAARVGARVNELEMPDEARPRRSPRSRLVREWRAMSGRDAEASEEDASPS